MVKSEGSVKPELEQFITPIRSELPFASVPKQVPVQSLSCENEFNLQGNERVSETHCHMNGFT